MQDESLKYWVQGAMIAAIYVVLTLILNAFSFGQIQLRLSEALTILPVFTPAAVPGLFAGCLIANILGRAELLDVIFGSLATLIGAALTRRVARVSVWLAPVPPIVANALIVPFVLRFAYGIPTAIPLMMLTVGIGEILSCGAAGLLLYRALLPYSQVIFGHTDGDASR